MKVRALALLVATALLGCGGPSMDPEVASASAASRADYDVFALRCSKCHSLARPLNSGIDDDGYWRTYVAKMRRQPGSGISAQDSVAILRFLHQYSIEQRRRKGKPVDSPALTAPSPAPSETGGS